MRAAQEAHPSFPGCPGLPGRPDPALLLPFAPPGDPCPARARHSTGNAAGPVPADISWKFFGMLSRPRPHAQGGRRGSAAALPSVPGEMGAAREALQRCLLSTFPSQTDLPLPRGQRPARGSGTARISVPRERSQGLPATCAPRSPMGCPGRGCPGLCGAVPGCPVPPCPARPRTCRASLAADCATRASILGRPEPGLATREPERGRSGATAAAAPPGGGEDHGGAARRGPEGCPGNGALGTGAAVAIDSCSEKGRGKSTPTPSQTPHSVSPPSILKCIPAPAGGFKMRTGNVPAVRKNK